MNASLGFTAAPFIWLLAYCVHLPLMSCSVRVWPGGWRGPLRKLHFSCFRISQFRNSWVNLSKRHTVSLYISEFILLLISTDHIIKHQWLCSTGGHTVLYSMCPCLNTAPTIFDRWWAGTSAFPFALSFLSPILVDVKLSRTLFFVPF